MSMTLITAPMLEPLSLDDAKLHLRVTEADEDALISSLITVARMQAEHELSRALITQTWELTLDAFPEGEILLGKPTVQSIVSVKYLDTAGVEQTIDPSGYELDAHALPGWLFPIDAWPAAYDGANSVRVRFTAGYGPSASDVPANVAQWMKLQLGALYRNREAFAAGVSVAELPNRFTAALLDSERVYF